MALEDRVLAAFADSIETKREAASSVTPLVVAAGELIAEALIAGGKLLIAGNGGSAADAQHAAAEFVNRFELERPGLPAIAVTTDSSVLTSIANDYQFDQVFARQVHALGRSGDVVLVITTSGNSPNIGAAIDAAHDRELPVILLSGRNGGDATRALGPADIEVRVPADATSRIQEVHILIIHCLCDLVDHILFGAQA